ncbi:MAG: glycosyltransferase [Propionibacteriaceae bacterium]|nr:glycosyltransferase [Propionibacteriaceae bacterium]
MTVNYNNAWMTTLSVQSVLANFDADSVGEIVVVDNASHVSDYERLLKMTRDLKKVRVIRGETNSGYFRGLNCGLGALVKAEYSAIVICNNDLYFERDFVGALCRRLEAYENDVLVVAPDIITLSSSHQNPQYVKRVPKARRLGYAAYFSNRLLAMLIDLVMLPVRAWRAKGKGAVFSAEMQPICLCTGACMVLLPAFFEKEHQLDDSVFMYGEEALLAHQVRRAGGLQVFDPALRVHHFDRGSTGSLPRRALYDMQRRSYKIYKQYL